jgi:hypothetical protein
VVGVRDDDYIDFGDLDPPDTTWFDSDTMGGRPRAPRTRWQTVKFLARHPRMYLALALLVLSLAKFGYDLWALVA